MSDIIKDIAAAISAVPPRVTPEHPQIIDGILYVTKEQFDGLLKYADDRPFEDRPPFSISGIPVHILLPGQHVTREDGSVLCVTSWGEMYDIKHIDPVHVSYQPLSLAPHSYAYKPIVDVELPGDDESDPSRVHEY